MDEKDFQILRAMGLQPYLPGLPPADARKTSRLAERVGLGVKAVRGRLAAMEAAGVITGYDAYPNLQHLSVSWRSFHFRLTDEGIAAFVAAARPLDGVVGHFRFLGGDVCVDLCYQDEAELRRRIQVLSNLAGASPWEFYDNQGLLPSGDLTPLDWRVIRELRHDALRPFADVAAALHVTERTVRRRFERMIDQASLWIVPRVDFSRVPSFIPFGLVVRFAMEGRDGLRSRAAEIRRLIEPRTLYSWVPPSPEVGHLVLFVFAETTAGVEETRHMVQAVSGVASVRTLIPTGMEATHAWLDEAIGRKAGQA